jgi:hypothetical protein
VLNEHVYRVTDIGVLVHNICKLDANNPNVMGHIFKNSDGHVITLNLHLVVMIPRLIITHHHRFSLNLPVFVGR